MVQGKLVNPFLRGFHPGSGPTIDDSAEIREGLRYIGRRLNRECQLLSRLFSLFLAAVIWAGLCLAGMADGRIALVIGNGNYEAANPLKNPTTDAKAVTAALTAAGFEVIYTENLTYSDMVRQLGSFQRMAAKADSAVIYFAGHGMEIDNQNYLIPVDAQLEFVSDADFQTVPLQLLQRAVSEAHVLGLVIVDACRNNPFATRLSQLDGNRGVGFGLARVEPGGNTVVALAAREGTFAFDGKGENSPYAVALVRAIQTPGLEIGKLFRQLHDDVLAATNGAQEPVQFGNLPSQDYFFLPPVEEAAAAAPAAAVVAAPVAGVSDVAVALQMELAFWQAADGGGGAQDYGLYLESYPDGKFAPLARARLARLSAPAAAPAPAIAAEPGAVPAAEPVVAPTPAPEPAPEPVVEPVVEPVDEPVIVAPAPAAEAAAQPEPAPPVVLAEPAAPSAAPDQPAPPALADGAAVTPDGGQGVASVAVPDAPEDLAVSRSGSSSGDDPVSEPELTGPPLYAALQTALTAAGCDPGPVDGAWGAGSGRALEAFASARPDLVAPGTPPGAALLRAMAKTSGRVCVTCARGEVLVGGTCQKPASCPSGLKMSSKGECYVPTPAVQKPSRKPVAKACVVFNGQKIC